MEQTINYHPRIAPWERPSPEGTLVSAGIIIHGIKSPGDQLNIPAFDQARGDEKMESPGRYAYYITMPDSPLETRIITVSLKTKNGASRFRPFVAYLKLPEDDINLIVMDVVMLNNTPPNNLPVTIPGGGKFWSYDLKKLTTLQITVNDNGTVTDLFLTRIPAPNQQKPTKFEVTSAATFSARRGHDISDHFYIHNASLGITVVANWDDNGNNKDDCIIWVYTGKDATVTFS